MPKYNVNSSTVLVTACCITCNHDRFIHEAVDSFLMQKTDFANLSSRVSIYSSNDDYSGNAMTNPTLPENFTNVTHADVIIERHVIIGSGSVVLPGVTLEEGVAIGALSLVMKSCEAFGIYAGSPLRKVRTRKQDLFALEAAFLKAEDSDGLDT